MASKARVASRPDKIDHVRYEPLMIRVGKARSLLWTLERLGDIDNDFIHDLANAPEDTHGWLLSTVADALGDELDKIEEEYRKLGTGGRLALADGTLRVDDVAKWPPMPGEARAAGRKAVA